MPESLTRPVIEPARFARLAVTALELVGRSTTIARAQELLLRAVAGRGGVLLVAESGTDVDSVARELHARSCPAIAPYVAVDCAEEAGRLERALFGLGAAQVPDDLEVVSPDCRIADARGGTLFLQDVQDLPAGVQARLARIARDGEVHVNGDALATDIRFVAGASPGIDGNVRARRFRSDLYRRLSSFRIDLPPLNERPADVPLLATRLLDEVCAERRLPGRTFTEAALALLAAVTWPGNTADLRRVIECVLADHQGSKIQIEHLLGVLRLDRAPAPFVPTGNLREARQRFERDYIGAVLQHHGWRMAEAARTLGIQRPNLYRKARQLGIALTRTSE